ncbi:MAG: sensor histidine kinase [Thermoleophilia bacterium]
MTRSRRDWIVDWIAFVLAVGLGVSLSLSTDLHGPPWAALNYALGGAMCLALWWRRRFPVELGLAAVVVGAVAPMGGVACAVAMFGLAVHRPARIAIPVGVLNAASSAVYAGIFPDDGTTYLVAVVFGCLLIAVIVGWGMYVRARREVVAGLRERAARAEAEQQFRVERARHAERERIAREMHDVLAHRLSLLSLHAGALEFRPDAPREDVARAAAVIRENAHRGLEELRAVIGALRDGADDAEPEPPQPTLADLPRLVEESRAAGMRVTPEYRLADLAATPGDIGRHAYRIAQEGLTNARKHAPRSSVRLTVAGAPGDGLTLELRNPLPIGQPSTGIPGAGAGIAGLSERVSLAGGRIEHGRTSEGDYRLTAWLPWTAA